MSYFSIEKALLNSVGQAWNFLALLGCSYMQVYNGTIGNQTKDTVKCVCGILPNGKHVRYMELGDVSKSYESRLDDVIKDFENRYNSTSNEYNAVVFLEMHFNLSVYREHIYEFRMGDKGVGVIFIHDGKYFSLEMAHKIIYHT